MKPSLTLIALALLALVGAAHAKGYHYHAPKMPTYHYHAPKTYAPRNAVPVSGYFRSNGTYVMPSHRTSPNNTRTDNWSSRPNVNPYTGKEGTKDPYKTCCGGL